jgi:rod shape-determining protein MreC
MESFFSRYRNALVLIAVLLAQVIGLAVQVRRPGSNPEDRGSVRLIRSWVVGLVTPPERLLHWTGLGIRGVWVDYIDLVHVRQQNQQLKTELGQVRLEEDSLAENARQALRLQSLLGFQEKYIYKTVAAQVIGTSGTEQSHVLLIDKGSDSGLKPDMPVITPDGIVGKIRDVFSNTSQVLEISDETSGAGVILVNTRIEGVLRGNTWGQPQIVDVSPDDRIRAGEPVVTSGGDGIYPRGLSVGTVDRVVPNAEGTLINVLIKPAANLSALEEVLVITSTGNQMPAPMQQDLSQAVRTADILAARLPSANTPGTPAPQGNATTQPPSNANSLPPPPPQPPAPVHPDRYSAGGVPPASDLVPGQPITPIVGGAPSAGTPGAAAQGATSSPAAPRKTPAPPQASGRAAPHPAPITPHPTTPNPVTPHPAAPHSAKPAPNVTQPAPPPQGGH